LVSVDSLSWSADGRWLAFLGCTYATRCGVVVVRSNGAGARVVDNEPSSGFLQNDEAVWSPRGRVLAYLVDESVRTFDLATGERHVLVARLGCCSDTVSSISWSPDGTKIAYDVFDDESASSELDTVSLQGQVHSLGVYPQTGALAWTTPPAGLHYQAPEPVEVAATNEVMLRVPVDELSADGDAVAFATCGAISVWRPSAMAITTVHGELPLCSPQEGTRDFYSLALAGDRVSLGEVIGGGMSQESALFAAPIETNAAGQGLVPSGPQMEVLAGSPETTGGDPRGTSRVGYLLGAGSLLVFSSWAYCDGVFRASCLDEPIAQRPVVSQTLWRVREPSWPGSCPGSAPLAANFDLPSARCEQLRVEPGPLRPLDVDAGRIVVSGTNATLVLDSSGATLLSLPVSTPAAQLAGNDLAILLPGELRDYDAVTGALLHT
jgi:hypothetical protein